MRCQACDYELWHCTGRVCPECGEGFTLEDFEFEKETVLFHCPHCNHGVEGVGENGCPDIHIEQCSSCGLANGLDYYIVRPILGIEASHLGGVLPIRTDTGNWFSRYFQTIWLVMTRPGRTMGRIPIHEPLTKAWSFLLTTFLITSVITMFPVLFMFAIPLFGSGGLQGGLGIAEIFLFIGIQVLLVFISLLFYVVAWSATTHVILLMTGGCSFTFNRTMQAILYSGGASIVSIVPCLGGITGTVWWAVSAINMVSRGQRVSGKRATFAVLAAPVLLTLCCCGGYGLLIYTAVSQRILPPSNIQLQTTSQVIPEIEEDSTVDQQSE